MGDWQISSLEEVVKFIDYRGRTPQKTEDGMRLITAKNVKMGYLQNEPMEFVSPKIYDEWMRRGIPKKGDVLFTTEAPLGNIAQLDTDEKVVFAQRIIIMQPKRGVIDSTFLKYMLLSNLMQERIHEKGTGATVKGIKSQLLKKVQISFPQFLPEQKRIVTILDEAFEGIDRAIAIAEKNLANARELFESYLNAIFTQKGDGWVEKKLGEVCTLQRGFDLPKQLRQEGSYPLVSSSGVIDCHIEPKVKGPGIATGRSGSIGNVFYIDQDFWPLNTVLYVKDFHGNDIQFIYHLLKQFDLQKYAGGTGVPTLNRNNVHDVMVKIPSLINSQKKIVLELNELKAETQRLETIYRQKIAALKELKQSILQKAFTGELTADTVEKAA